MRAKVLSIVAILGLAVALPLSAQVPEDDPNLPEEQQQQEQQQEQQEQPVEPQDQSETESDIRGEAELEAEAEADVEGDMEALPRTASPLALLALLGAGGLGSAVALRIRRRR